MWATSGIFKKTTQSKLSPVGEFPQSGHPVQKPVATFKFLKNLITLDLCSRKGETSFSIVSQKLKSFKIFAI
jgi:hypothetical protein